MARRLVLAVLLLLGVAQSGRHAALLEAAADPAAGKFEPGDLLAAIDKLARRPPVAYVARRWLEAELVDRGERGWMEVSSCFDPLSGLTHVVLSQGGSKRIRERALESFLEKEVEATRDEDTRRAALSSENYLYRVVDAPIARMGIELTPRRPDARLLRGVAFVNPRDGALERVEGTLARNPSFWVRDVHVARVYTRIDGATLPTEMVFTARIRMYGPARLRVRTEYSSVGGHPVPIAGGPTGRLAAF
jgi:hypothetical protein